MVVPSWSDSESDVSYDMYRTICFGSFSAPLNDIVSPAKRPFILLVFLTQVPHFSDPGPKSGSTLLGSSEMDPPLVNDSSFSAANPSSYTLSEIWPFPVNDSVRSGLRLSVNSGQAFTRPEHSGNKDVSAAEESTVTDLTAGWGGRKTRDLNSEDDSSKMVSSSSSGNELKESGDKKRKICGSESGNGDCSMRPEGETSSGGGGGGSKGTEQKNKPEPPKDYIHVRARRGQATDRHSLAERARREKISEKMTALQDIIPGCNKIIGKALVLDEIINYIQSLQRQVEFLSMKLEVVNSSASTGPTIGVFPSGDLGTLPIDVHRTIYEQQEANETRMSQPEWLHMQVDGNFNRTT